MALYHTRAQGRHGWAALVGVEFGLTRVALRRPKAPAATTRAGCGGREGWRTPSGHLSCSSVAPRGALRSLSPFQSSAVMGHHPRLAAPDGFQAPVRGPGCSGLSRRLRMASRSPLAGRDGRSMRRGIGGGDNAGPRGAAGSAPRVRSAWRSKRPSRGRRAAAGPFAGAAEAAETVRRPLRRAGPATAFIWACPLPEIRPVNCGG